MKYGEMAERYPSFPVLMRRICDKCNAGFEVSEVAAWAMTQVSKINNASDRAAAIAKVREPITIKQAEQDERIEQERTAQKAAKTEARN